MSVIETGPSNAVIINDNDPSRESAFDRSILSSPLKSSLKTTLSVISFLTAYEFLISKL